MRKGWKLLTILVVFALFIAACGGDGESSDTTGSDDGTATTAAGTETTAVDQSQSSGESVDIILVAHAASAWDSFWVVVEKGNYDAAADLGVNVQILAPDEWCPACMVELIQQAVAAQPDAIGVTTSDGALFEDALNQITAAGIPWLQYNSGDQRPEGEKVTAPYIGQNEYVAGFNGAKRFLEAGATKGVCVNQAVGSTNLDKRCAGFVDGLAEGGVSAEVLAITNDFGESQGIISDYAAANPDVDTYLTLGPNGTTPFYNFVDAEGRSDLIHGTFDLNEQIVGRIKDGGTLFAIDQQPYIQGYLVVAFLTWKVRYGIDLPADLLTGPGFVDASNASLVESVAGTYR